MGVHLLENILILCTGFIGLVIVLIILGSIKSNIFTNLYLVLLIAFVSIRFILIAVIQLNMNLNYLETPSPYKTLLLISIPCSYLYFKSLVSENRNFDKSSLYHFILPLSLFFLNLILKVKTATIGPLCIKINYVFTFILVIFYILLSFRLLHEKLWTKENAIRFQNYSLIRNWTIFLFSICFLLGVRLLTSITFEIIHHPALTGGKYALTIASGAWLLIFMKLLISPELLHGLPKLKKIVELKDKSKIPHYGNWKLGPAKGINAQDLKLKSKMDEKMVQLITDLECYSEEERIFQQINLNIKDLALHMKIPTSHLVYLFKYHSNLTFVEYKSLQRISHSIHLIQCGYLDMNTLESLSSEVGYASYNPFFTAFKKHTGHSPVDYTLKIKQ